MGLKLRRIDFYRNIEGKSSVEDFIDSLDSKQAQKLVWTLKIIKELDFVPKQYFKKIDSTKEIWEIRVGQQIRLLCFWDNENLIILTNGFIKKTMKIPKRELETAKKRMLDYIERKKI